MSGDPDSKTTASNGSIEPQTGGLAPPPRVQIEKRALSVRGPKWTGLRRLLKGDLLAGRVKSQQSGG